GTGGTTPIVKPWHAYAWDHSIDVITDPVYVSAHDGNELTREGPTTATLIACWPPTRVSLPSWSTSSTGLAFNPNPAGTTTVTNNSVATGQPVTVTAQATQQAPFSGPLSAPATVNVMDVDIAASAVAEKNEDTTAVLVPVLTPTATSGGVPVSLSVAPTMGGTAKLEKSSSSFDVYSDAALSSSSALLCGTQTTATFASASSIPSPVYLKGITASTSTASPDTLTLSFTPSAQTGGNAPPEFKDKVSVSVLKVDALLPDTIEREIDDGDGNPDTRTFVVNMLLVAGSVITVTAVPAPSIAEANLPACWMLEVTEGTASGSGKLVRTIDRTQASKTVLRCSCGNEKITTVYVVHCTYSAFCDNAGLIGHGWWHLSIEPASAVQGVLRNISPPFTWMVNSDGGFFPVHQGQSHDDGWIDIGGQGHTATAHHDWMITFQNLVNGLNDLSAWLAAPGAYDYDTRNCVWGTIRIGNASGVAMPVFNYIPPPIPPFSGFWHPWHLQDWLNQQP
ncbi:MAG: hypothetical protein WC708_19865, partial [Lentisphaeria bacterium]